MSSDIPYGQFETRGPRRFWINFILVICTLGLWLFAYPWWPRRDWRPDEEMPSVPR